MSDNPINQAVSTSYLEKLALMQSQISRNVKFVFKPDGSSAKPSTNQFLEWLDKDFSYLKDPILFHFSRSIYIKVFFESSTSDISFETFEFPLILKNINPSRKFEKNLRNSNIKKVSNARAIIPEIEAMLNKREVKMAEIVRASMHQNSRQYLISLFQEPEYEEILKALWFDRKIWWQDLTIWPYNTCKRCGQSLGHPVSKVIGIGPECGGHKYETDEEFIDGFREVVFNFKKSKFFQVPAEHNPIFLVRMDEILSKMNRSR